MDGMSLYFQLTANLPRLKSRVRIPCPALKINNLAAFVGGFFHFWVLGAGRVRAVSEDTNAGKINERFSPYREGESR